MNVRHPMGTLHLFSIKNIFYDKMNLRLFYFDKAIWKITQKRWNLQKWFICSFICLHVLHHLSYDLG